MCMIGSRGERIVTNSFINMSILPVKSFQETLHKGYCGPASLKIMLGYYGVEKTEEELVRLTGADEKGEASDADIKRVAEHFGFCVEVQNEATFSDIEGWLARRVPVIVDWFTRGRADYSDSEVADGHYSVVAGLDDDFIYLQDPEIGGLRTIARDDFLKVWFDFSGEYIQPDELIVRRLIAVYKK